MSVIIGIDPGSRITGFGVIDSNGQRHRYLASGCIRMQSKVLAERVAEIYDNLTALIREYRPDEAAVEQVFMHENANSALKLGHARGAVLVALATHSLSVSEYSARRIKQAVVGTGAATKQQVQVMVTTLLKLNALPQADAADALACAICHANSSRY